MFKLTTVSTLCIIGTLASGEFLRNL